MTTAVIPAPAQVLREALEDRLLVDAILPLLKGEPLVPEDGADHARALPRALAAAGARTTLLAAARHGSSDALAAAVRLLREPPSPEVAHHLALLHGRFAETTSEPERAADHLQRALELWLWLWREDRYLTDLARRVAGDEGAALVDGLGAALLEPLVTSLRVGRRAATPAARRALAVLRGVPATAARAALPPERRAALEVVAASALAGVVREVLDEARLAAETVEPLRADAAERAAPFGLVLDFTAWAGFDPETVVFLLDQAQDQAWELYRANRMIDVRALLAPLQPAADELEARIGRDPGLFAYRALCAQTFTFLGETETELRPAIAYLERAIAVCPTHRNARLVLAGFLVAAAGGELARVAGIGLFRGEARRRALAEARRLHDRALALWPEVTVPSSVAAALAAGPR